MRLAPVRWAWVRVEFTKLALVRSCPLKSQPVRSLSRQSDALQVLGLIAGGRRELRCGESRDVAPAD